VVIQIKKVHINDQMDLTLIALCYGEIV